ncbi:hypothetical protein Tco_1069613 [Tanacetum coccineum]|uniref:Reverse transcriptase domain-containing protein n=1 Tax=Tanacetum coccineum TaxID=301880 RepID=A0ABQ5HKI6_9ASTR
MGDKHLDTQKGSLESSVKDPIPILRESADLSDSENECDVPINDDSSESHFTTFSNPLFDSNDDFSSDDESLSKEEIQKDEFKYFSNPLYDLDDEIITNEKIIPNQKDLDVVIPILPGINEHCFNAESDLLKSLLNHDSPIDSIKIDSIFDEFSFPRPPSEPPDVEICLHFKTDAPVIDNFHELNEDQRGSEIDFSQNDEDDYSFTFVIRTFLLFLTNPADSLLLLSTRSENTIFDPDIFA